MTTKISVANIQDSTLAVLGGNPKISTVAICDSSYTVLDDTAIDVAGGYIKITGSGFKTGATVTVNKTLATSVTFVSSTELRAQIPAQAAGTYVIYVVNTDGSVAIKINAITFSSMPTWVTGSTLANGSADTAISIQLSATDATTYSVQSGSTLPTGLTLSSGGLLSGTITGITSETTYNFTIVATDAELQDSPRTLSITITVGDPYWKYVSNLLSTQPITEPFNSDASINNAVLTIAGDTKPNNFSPYTPGYYSNFFNNTAVTTQYNLTTTQTAIGTGDFSIAMWVYKNAAAGNTQMLFDTGTGGLQLEINASGQLGVYNFVSASYPIAQSASTAINSFVWTHVALVRSSGTMTMYLNGTSVGTATVTSNFTSTTVTIGSRYAVSGSSWFGFNGYISDLLYTNNAITVTVPTSPYSSNANTKLLTCQANRFIDNSSNALSITATSMQVKSFTPYTPNTSYSTYGSTYFDGTGDGLLTANAANNLVNTDFTWEAWVYFTSLSTSSCIIACTTDTNNRTLFYYDTTNGLRYAVARSGSDQVSIQQGSTSGWYVNAWYHVALVRSGNNYVIYRNGVSIASGTSSYSQSDLGAGFSVSYSNVATSYLNYTGYITDVRVVNGTAVYTTAFTPPTSPLTAIANTRLLTCQSNQPVNNNVFLDNSTNNLAITRNGNTTQGTNSPYGTSWSNYFDGTGDYLSAPSNAAFAFGTGDYTVECWVYLTKTTYTRLWYFNSDSDNIDLNSGSVTGKIGYYNGSTLIESSTLMTLNTWAHIALVRASGTAKVYLNGSLVITQATTPNSTTRSMSIGGNVNDSLGGYISNFRVVKGTAVYTSTFTPSTTPLQAIAGTSLLTCQSNNLVDNSTNNFTITKNGDTSVQKFSPFAGTILPTPYYSNKFNGSSDYLSIADSANLEFGSGTITIECWFYMQGTSGYILDKNNSGTGVAAGFSLNISTTSVTWYYDAANNGYVISPITTTVSQNQWHHIALVRSVSGSTTNSIFLDGVRIGTSSTATAFPDNAQNFRIGCTFLSGSYYNGFNGYISNVRIVKGTAVYDPTQTSITVPTSPLTAITNTQLLTCQSNRFIDNSTNNFAITAATTTVKPTTVNPFTVTYSTKKQYSPDVIGGSMYFDGTGDYLTTATSSSLSYTWYNDVTVETWVNFNSVANAPHIWSISESSSVRVTLYVSSAVFKLFVNVGTGGSDIIISPTTLTAGQWYHVAITRSGSTWTMWLNGVSQGTSSSTTRPYSVAEMIAVGWQNYAGAAGDYLNGYVSDFRVVPGTALYTSNFVPQNSPLTSVKNSVFLMNGTSSSIYDSGELNNFETVGDAKLAQFGPYNAGYYSNQFNGSTDYLTVGSGTPCYMGTGTFTVEFFVYFNTLTSGDASNYQTLFGVNNAYNATGNFLIMNNYPSSGNLTIWHQNVAKITSSVNMTVGQWYHIALVRDSSTSLKLYVNGNTAGSATISSADTYGDTTNGFVVGSQNGFTSRSVNGYLSNVRVTKSQALYTAAFVPSTAPLSTSSQSVTPSNVSLLTCQSNRFIDNSTNAYTITAAGSAKIQAQNPFQNNSGQGYYFDGTGDYLTSPYKPLYALRGDFTIELWLYWTAHGSYGGIVGSANSNTSAAITAGWFLDFNSTNNTLQFEGQGSVSIVTTNAIPSNQWAHIAVVRSGSTITHYLNGVANGSGTSSTSFDSASLPLLVGIDRGSTSTLTGYISDLRITNGVARYTSAFTPPTSPYLLK